MRPPRPGDEDFSPVSTARGTSMKEGRYKGMTIFTILSFGPFSGGLYV